MSASVVNKLYVVAFRPTSFEKVVLLDRIKNTFKEPEAILKADYLFYGPPGVGKSLSASLLTKEHNTLYVNSPKDGKIEALREGGMIYSFCEEASLNDGEKIVFLDELSARVSDSFFEALKGLMDSYPKIRFVAVTNYIEQIPESILSRFNIKINFSPIDTEEEAEILTKYSNRIKAYCDKVLKLPYTEDGFNALIKKHYPDFRGVLGDLQQFALKNVTQITIKDVYSTSFEFKELYELIMNCKSDEAYGFHKLLMGKYALKAKEVLTALDNSFIEWVESNHSKFTSLIPNFIVVNAKYQSSIGNSMLDPALAMKACAMEYVLHINGFKLKNQIQ